MARCLRGTSLKKLVKGISGGQFKFIVIKEISRLTRDSQFWKEFFNLCQTKKCEIVIRGLPFDPNDPAGIFQLDLLASVAEYESRNTSKRIRESVLSALKNGGKFNSTHRRLGLEALVENGKKRSGLYQLVPAEIDTVNFIFKTFTRYGSHNKTLEVLNQKGIKNWNGKPFQRHALVTLLKDTRYISKWYRNAQNKNKDPKLLTPREQYVEVSLPHPPIISTELWSHTQKILNDVCGNMGRLTRTEHIFVLSGLLHCLDGTRFIGITGHGKTQTSHYYKNTNNKTTIRCDLIENNVKEIVSKLVQKEPALQSAIMKAGSEVQDNIQRIKSQIDQLKVEQHSLQFESDRERQKLNVLIEGESDLEDIKLFKGSFKEVLKRNQARQFELEQQAANCERALEHLSKKSFSWMDIANQVTRVQETLAEKDPAALKLAYKSLFEKIVIGPEDDNGVRTLTYVIKNHDISLEDISELSEEMVEAVKAPLTYRNHCSRKLR